jgi:biotin synthase
LEFNRDGFSGETFTIMKELEKKLETVYEAAYPEFDDLVYLLSLEKENELQRLYRFGDWVRHEHCGDGILLRGIIEFSNYCRNTCRYCGLHKNNTFLERFRLSKDEIILAADKIYESGIRTAVLQAGEDEDMGAQWLADVVSSIKKRYDNEMAVTLSVGEWHRQYYKLWLDAGADRYLLKIETSDRKLYEKFHPGMSYDKRVECIEDLKLLGYQVGSGSLIGLSGQTVEILASDILFYKKYDFDMLGIGLFIPHGSTDLKDARRGDLDMTLKMLAVTRIVMKNTHLPATTATGSIAEYDHRIDALKAGANVIMPNFTPDDYKELYEIYPNKRCVKEKNTDPVLTLQKIASGLDRYIDFSRGDTLKK